MVLRGLTIDKKPLMDHLDAVGHKEAFDYVLDSVKEKTLLSKSIIKQIHYLVLPCIEMTEAYIVWFLLRLPEP